jgi:hypothetical protein
MSDFYFIWRQSENSKSVLILVLTVMVIVQIAAWFLIKKVFSGKMLKVAYDVYLLSVVLTDAMVSVYAGMGGMA